MPIVTVQIISEDSEDPAANTQQLADALGTLFGLGAQETWVRLEHVPAACYAENEGASPGIQPTIVRVLKGKLPDQAALAEEAAAVAKTVATTLGRPVENTHVIYEPPGFGRVAFGGRLIGTDGSVA